jgi:TPR repeat protein
MTDTLTDAKPQSAPPTAAAAEPEPAASAPAAPPLAAAPLPPPWRIDDVPTAAQDLAARAAAVAGQPLSVWLARTIGEAAGKGQSRRATWPLLAAAALGGVLIGGGSVAIWQSAGSKDRQAALHAQAPASGDQPTATARSPQAAATPSASAPQRPNPGPEKVAAPGPAATPTPQPPPDGPLAALRRDAEAGNASAQFDLAARHASGDGVPQDWAAAFSLFERAARQGLATAQHNLGVLLERGRGAVPDPERAISWYGEAARQGYAPSQYNLALALLRRGDAADMDAAVDWLVRAAADLPQAHLPLAQIFEGGAGLRRDLGRARDHYAQAAAAGDPRAAARLAELTPDVVARETLREIQELLARLNFDPGVADGRPGPRSQAAIRRFQRANGLKEDGQASQPLLDRLRRAAGEG